VETNSATKSSTEQPKTARYALSVGDLQRELQGVLPTV
jgi:hypothetical protein